LPDISKMYDSSRFVIPRYGDSK